MNHRSIAAALVLIFSTTSLFAQLTNTEKKEVVDQLSKEMIARYVIKEKAQEVAKMIQTNFSSGKYDSLTTGKDFALKLSQDANAICKDAHFRIRFSESVLPIRKEAGEPSKQELEADAKFVRLINAGFEEVKRLGGNIGYIRFFGFQDPKDAERAIQASMQFVQNTDALIFDIRDNGGGAPATVKMLCSYLFDKPTHINSLLMRRGDKTEKIDFKTGTPKGKRYSNPVYVIVSKRTGSGAEEFAYNLQTQKRATILGENTWGGANPGGNVRLNDHFMAFIPVGMAQNPITMTNWEGTGVTPDVKCDPKESLKLAQIMAIKKLLETAQGDDITRLKSVLKELEG
jgi:retinol-binding protein 3